MRTRMAHSMDMTTNAAEALRSAEAELAAFEAMASRQRKGSRPSAWAPIIRRNLVADVEDAQAAFADEALAETVCTDDRCPDGGVTFAAFGTSRHIHMATAPR